MAQARQSLDANAYESERRVKGSEVFVGGLARTVTESTIREVFSPYGEIVNIRMMKDQSGNSKGYCFVRFTTKAAALKAEKEKDGFTLQGKKIGVAPSSDQDSLFLGNIRKDWNADELDKMVRQAFQDVVSVDLVMASNIGNSPSGKNQQNRGFAFVRFPTHAAAARAHRVGTRQDFLLGGKWRPIVDWADKEPEIDPEDLAKIKIAYVGNLPSNVNEEYLEKLFEPFGKLDRVSISRKSNPLVGFVHFAKRSDLDNAIKEMDGKTVQGPEKGPKFKLQVSVARIAEKAMKRERDEYGSKPASRFGNRDKYSRETLAYDSSDDQKSKVRRLKHPIEASSDPYEEAVVSLPSAVTERLLRIFRLGIATRYDIDIHCINSLKELPESAAVAVLDQFLLTGSDGRNKGALLAGLIVKHQVGRSGLSREPSSLPRRGADYASNMPRRGNDFDSNHPRRGNDFDSNLLRRGNDFDSNLPRRGADFDSILPRRGADFDSHLPRRGADFDSHLPRRGADFDSHLPRRGADFASDLPRRGADLPSRESELLDFPGQVHAPSFDPLPSRSALTAPTRYDRYSTSPRKYPYSSSILDDPPLPSRTSFGKLGETGPLSSYREPIPLSTGYGGVSGTDSRRTPAVERPSQVKFDPFTGAPYKFDPFTGEPVNHDPTPQRSGSFF